MSDSIIQKTLFEIQHLSGPFNIIAMRLNIIEDDLSEIKLEDGSLKYQDLIHQIDEERANLYDIQVNLQDIKKKIESRK